MDGHNRRAMRAGRHGAVGRAVPKVVKAAPGVLAPHVCCLDFRHAAAGEHLHALQGQTAAQQRGGSRAERWQPRLQHSNSSAVTATAGPVGKARKKLAVKDGAPLHTLCPGQCTWILRSENKKGSACKRSGP